MGQPISSIMKAISLKDSITTLCNAIIPILLVLQAIMMPTLADGAALSLPDQPAAHLD
ncbi:hypothetical protein [Parasphingorhabdus sp.]|uniref:hypothetical protein n=1 Tax=Parasphingorhabdus sp. TaxID=2709688 RepID=UPI003263A248